MWITYVYRIPFDRIFTIYVNQLTCLSTVSDVLYWKTHARGRKSIAAWVSIFRTMPKKSPPDPGGDDWFSCCAQVCNLLLSLKILSILQGANSHILPISHIWDSKAYSPYFIIGLQKFMGGIFPFISHNFLTIFLGETTGMMGWGQVLNWVPWISPELPSIIFWRFFLRFFSFSLPFFSFSLKYNWGSVWVNKGVAGGLVGTKFKGYSRSLWE